MPTPTPAESKPASLRVEAEVPFGFEEIFFSRTDARGVIQAGNHVFQRVSGYDWPNLIGAPHRIVRHPAMPKGVFHLMWARIKAGLPTGAYVCNRAQDGRSYWVFAVMVPLSEGFLSVRIKPGSSLLDQVRQAYADLIRFEESGASPADSSMRLVERLAQAGYPSYDSFQARALAQEVLHRGRQIGRALPGVPDAVDSAESADGIETELEAMQSMFDVARMISINLRVLSSKLGDVGRPVSSISTNYAVLASDMTSWLQNRALNPERGFVGIARSVSEGLFLSNAARILSEMAQDFAADGDAGGADARAESIRLTAIAADYHDRAAGCLRRMFTEAQEMGAHLAEMRYQVSGLNSIRILCRIEGAVLREHGVSLDQIVTQLDEFQDELEGRLSRTMDLSQKIRRVAGLLQA